MNKETKKSQLSLFTWTVRNILVGFAAFLLILFCYNKVPGYKWVYDGLLRGNIEYIKKYGNLSLDQRYEMKLGYTYAYLRYIKANTPDSAVILMPGNGEVYFPKNAKSDFTGEPMNILWLTRFLHPRKIVYDTDTNNKYADKITHVAIVNGWGYDKLPYQVSNPMQNGILPIVMN